MEKNIKMPKTINVKSSDTEGCHLLTLLGLTIGFDETEKEESYLVLFYKGVIVATIDGEMITAFSNIQYVIDNQLIEI